ncbi:MAG: hypothetical protein JST49_13155 [Bacteroidetes bacterium]|nr:hypothetical protein [Bacteroidota bacterium]
MQENHNMMNAELTLLFATISWAGNLYNWQQLDSNMIAPLMHLVQIAAAIVAIAIGVRTLLRNEGK